MCGSFFFLVTFMNLIITGRLPGNQGRLKEVTVAVSNKIEHVTPWLSTAFHLCSCMNKTEQDTNS